MRDYQYFCEWKTKNGVYFRFDFRNGFHYNKSVNVIAARIGRQMHWIEDLGDYEKWRCIKVFPSDYKSKYLDEKEIVGTLVGFDDYVNMVLEDVVEYEMTSDGKRRITKLDEILLNGNHITMLVPGGEGPEI